MKNRYLKSALSVCLAGAVALSPMATAAVNVYAAGTVNDLTIRESEINQLLTDDLVLPEDVDGVAVTYELGADADADYVTLSKNVLKITRPYAGDGDYDFTLKATVNGETKEFPLTIAEGVSEDTYAGYVYVSFASTNPDDTYKDVQQIHMFLSEDGLNWTAVNSFNPIFEVGTDYADKIKAVSDRNYEIVEGTDITETTTGDASVLFPFEGNDQGVRDPYIIRGCKDDGSDSDKVWILATDLNTMNSKYGGSLSKDTVGSWGDMARKGSTSLFIYETDDWVHWTRRYVDVGSEVGAGAAWAPEAVYNPEKDNYLVYWSCRTSADGYARNRLYCNETEDFVTFGETKLYEQEDFYAKWGNLVSGSDGYGNIDTSQLWVADEDSEYGTLYRLVKDESNNHIQLMSADSVLDPDVDYDATEPTRITPYTKDGTTYSAVTDIAGLSNLDKAEVVWNWFKNESVGDHFQYISQSEMESKSGAYEGATMFKFNDRDEWCVMIDYYGNNSIRYEPYTTTDLSEPDSIKKVSSGYGRTGGDVGTHGGMIPITAAEYNAIIDTYNAPSTDKNYHKIEPIKLDRRGDLATAIDDAKDSLNSSDMTEAQKAALEEAITQAETLRDRDSVSDETMDKVLDRIDALVNPDKVTVSRSEVTLKAGTSETVTAAANDENLDITWNSGDSTVATVENGKITAVGKGSTFVFAKAGKQGLAVIRVVVE